MVTHPDAGVILDLDPQELPRFVEKCLLEHHRVLAKHRPNVRKDAPETAVTIVHIPGLPAVCVKEFRTRGRLHALKSLFRHTQGRRAFVNGGKLLDAGVGAALPLALIQERRFGAVETEWIVMEHLADAVELDRYLVKRIEAGWSADERRSLALALGRFIGTLHGRGIYHADLKTCNVLVYDGAAEGCAVEPPSRRARFSLLDYDDVSFSALVNDRRKVKNLTQLFLSTPTAVRASDRLRFLREYALHAGINRKERKIIARRVRRQAAGRRILYVGLNGDVVEDWETKS
ncbi:MAG: lipopolysaccharide kinase InaA family protein [Desulfomonile sp.]|nr:lipopolysaccharide kinase InaA family protein [Desulfomonile sp.]